MGISFVGDKRAINENNAHRNRGFLYPAGTFLFEDFDFTFINEVAPFSDDIYFKWIEMEKRVCVVKVYKNKKHNPYYIANTQEFIENDECCFGKQ